MIIENTSLKPYNTFGLDAKARYFGSFSSSDELKSILNKYSEFPLLILGGGSNILLTKDFDGLVLRNLIEGIELITEDETEVLVKVGAGEVWHNFVIYCIEKGWGGLENLSLIPGSVGASPMQNIGAYGVEIKDVFEKLEAYHLASQEIHTFDNATCKFGYRESIFKHEVKGQYIITHVYYRLKKNPQLNTSYGAIEQQLKIMGISSPSIKDVSNAVIHIRQSKLPNPAEIGNAGSFFKNPVIPDSLFEKLKVEYPEIPNYSSKNGVKLAAGWLIEQTGWKGKTLDKYGVHKLQALVLVNYGGATGLQIFKLSEEIIQSVKDKFNVTLEREVNIL